jgi:hypothetical protein
MKFIVLLLMMLAGITKASSQDILTQTISWASGSTRNVTTNTVVSESTTFVSNVDGGFAWKNADGTFKNNYRIIEAIGEWTNVQMDGRIQYEVTDGKYSGTIAFTKVNNQTHIRISMESDPTEVLELTIISFTAN